MKKSILLLVFSAVLLSLYTQMVGRGLRLYNGKKELLLIDCVGVTGKLDICFAPDLFGIGRIPEKISSENLNGKLLTEIEEIINNEMNKLPDWKINAQLVQLFATEGKYDTHGINFVMQPNGDMTCSVGEGKVFRVFAEDMAGNSHANITHKGYLIRSIPTAQMQDILDNVYQILVCEYQKSIYLWDIDRVMQWGMNPASESQKSMIYKKIKKLKNQDIDIENLTKYEASVLIDRFSDKEVL